VVAQLALEVELDALARYEQGQQYNQKPDE
jgi:hypothetical protein